MIILGVSGNIQMPYDDWFYEYRKLLTPISHDASAVLLKDGYVLTAIEEERTSRVKHNGNGAYTAFHKCLEQNGINILDIDKVAIHCREDALDHEAEELYIGNFSESKTAKSLVQEIIYKIGQPNFPKEKIAFVEHHICHAANAYYGSGFEDALIMTVDGDSPEGYAGYVISARNGKWDVLEKIVSENSLGAFYNIVIRYLAYEQHDEYKVMGLAPYGDPKRFRDLMENIYTLLPEGKHLMHLQHCRLISDNVGIRRKGEPITQEHKDLAAALQEALEIIAMHKLSYYRQKTGHTRLCLSGGVAHNCSMNGKILYSGLFDEMYVQPAAHDGGNPLGAAMMVAHKAGEKVQPVQNLFLGTDIGDEASIGELLQRWGSFVKFKREADIVEAAAQKLTVGYVLGWVQGRSEFGPRALGNRSILADPRPAENKTIINAMVKKREAYRPFAPSILEEHLEEYYEVPRTKADLSFMNFVMQTKEDKKALLGAVTHVDGSARVQTVSRTTNGRYWDLIDRFHQKTGVPILLNTSFNNDVEPIVDTEFDALVCFLTTNLHYLVIGDYLIEKKEALADAYLHMMPSLPFNGMLTRVKGPSRDGPHSIRYIVRLNYRMKYTEETSEDVYSVLEKSDGVKSVSELFQECGLDEACQQAALEELQRLWSRRVIKLDC